MSGWELEKSIIVDEYYEPEEKTEDQVQEMPWTEFLAGVECGFLTDYDGYAYDPNMKDTIILPSQASSLNNVPETVAWVNK
jgi:hypothetical protein